MPFATRSLSAAGALSDQADVKLCGFDLSAYSRLKQFILLGTGVFFFYLIHGVLQEDVFKLNGVNEHIWFANLIQFFVCTLFGLLELRMRHELHDRRASLTIYTIGGLLTVLTVALGNEACYFLNYPTLIVFKCCKLVPLLICGIIIQHKRYSALQFLGCILMTMGLSMFVLADSTVESDSLTQSSNLQSSTTHAKVTGVALISIAVLSDAALTNVQEHVMSVMRVNCTELITYTYAVGTALIGLRCLIEGGTSGLSASAAFFGEPVRFGKLVAFGASSYLGVLCFALLVRTNGSLVAVMLNTCRRGITIVLSFLLYSKPFTYVYLLAGVVVLLGLALNLREDERRKRAEREQNVTKTDANVTTV